MFEIDLPPFDPSKAAPGRVRVDLGARSYGVAFAEDFAAGLREAALALDPRPDKIGLASDANVWPLWGAKAARALEEAGFEVVEAVMGAGEPHKNLEALAGMWDRFLDAKLTRRSAIAAVGGGVVGDMAGFAAATLLRGTRLVQVPTTLLAMVDSSVGGKTGINRPQGKNLIGAFHQPSAVVVAPGTLATLPIAEVRAGLAEVVKYGVIADPGLFAYLEREAEAILALDGGAVRRVVARSVAVKAEVVRLDEREGGLRAILNFGHTLGHALESATGYAAYRHGEAVALGMVAAGNIALGFGAWSEKEQARLEALLRALGLPVRVAPEIAAGLDAGTLIDKARSDKKALGGTIRFVLPARLGATEIRSDVGEAAVREALRSIGAA